MTWDDRFQASVPERLTTSDGLALLDLIKKNLARLKGALEARASIIRFLAHSSGRNCNHGIRWPSAHVS